MWVLLVLGKVWQLKVQQVPFIVIGTVIGIIGSGLFLLLDLNTSTALWAVYLVVCGVGTGLAINLVYAMVQTVLP